MGVKAENRYQKLNRRQIDEMSRKLSHPWLEIIRSQGRQISELREEILRLQKELQNTKQERDKAVKAYHRRNAETRYLKETCNDLLNREQ